MFLSGYRFPNDIPIVLGMLRIRNSALLAQKGLADSDATEASVRVLAYRLPDGSVLVFHENEGLISDGVASGPEVEVDAATLTVRSAQSLRDEVSVAFGLNDFDWDAVAPDGLESLAHDVLEHRRQAFANQRRSVKPNER